MVRTTYSPGNSALLLMGIAVALGAGWVSMMTMAFGADPVHDLRTGAVMVALWSSFLLIPASLIAFKWAMVGAITSWGIVVFCCVCLWASPAVFLVFVPAAIEGLIATAIASRSEGPPPITVVPK
jgi:hypothetical protein